MSMLDEVIAMVEEEVRADTGLTLTQIAHNAGVPKGTLKHIYYRTSTNPRFESVQRLYDFLTRYRACKAA